MILGEATSSLSQGVDILSDYALKSGADLILVNSHGRTGFKRLFLGSFAEALLHRSHVPVLVVGQKNSIASKLQRIIFPTEFGDHSKELFRQAMDVAHQVGAQIQLLHVIPQPDQPVLDFDFQSTMRVLGGEQVPYQIYREHHIQHQARRARSWAEFSEHRGVKVETVIDTESDTVSDAILKLSRKNAIGRIIIMEAQSSALRDSILGSTTKKVIRLSSCPVWVLTSSYVEQLFRKAAA
jgi:nucleotide-binding universal stress UspA family protein